MTHTVETWLIPDGWMPPAGSGEVAGHEAVCVLNLSDTGANLTFAFYFENRGPQKVTGLFCDAQRTRHFRLDFPEELQGFVLEAETPYALEVSSDQPVTVQHTRVDTRGGGIALMTTMAVRGGVS